MRELAGGTGPVLGVFGRLDPHKGHREILGVLPRLRERLDVRAIFVGADDQAHAGYREQLAGEIEAAGLDDAVSLPGFRSDAVELIAGCDVLVIPSVTSRGGLGSEGFSLRRSRGDGASARRSSPTTHGGLPEVLGECGLLVPPGDRDALAEALLRVLEDGALSEQLAECGRRRAARAVLALSDDRGDGEPLPRGSRGVIAGVVPAAGHAKRLRGLIDGSKELVPVRGRPVIDGLLERLAPADEIRVVVRPAKRDLIEHLRGHVTLVEGEPRTVAESLALGMAGLAADDLVLTGFPDTLFEAEQVFERLLAALGPHDVALGAFRFAEPSRSDVLELDGATVTRVHVRPQQPASNLVWGCFAARRGALESIERDDEPGQFFDRLARAGRVVAVDFEAELVDIGTPQSLAAAS